MQFVKIFAWSTSCSNEANYYPYVSSNCCWTIGKNGNIYLELAAILEEIPNSQIEEMNFQILKKMKEKIIHKNIMKKTD